MLIPPCESRRALISGMSKPDTKPSSMENIRQAIFAEDLSRQTVAMNVADVQAHKIITKRASESLAACVNKGKLIRFCNFESSSRISNKPLLGWSRV